MFLETVGPVAVVGISAVLLNAMMNIDANFGPGGLQVALGLAVVATVGAPAYFIDGQINWLVFNRRKLLRLVTIYNQNHYLSPKITRRKMFKRELEKLNKQ